MELDIGMLVIRLALGPMLVLHGLNKIFGSGGLAGTTRWFGALGLQPAWLHARLAAATEIVAGLLLALGLLTGLACSAFVGLMLVAALTDHRGKGYFVFKGGSEYVLLVALVAVGIAAIGPGAWSLDHVADLDLDGVWWALAAAVLGALAALGLLVISRRPQPADEAP
ncbi:DoxX family protein [Nocardioides sp. cx-169]|uniref:DoxX family protein n=1 Tax=Nocardioides sp. cx-169 TaxID=2899080 RepID=UPI001E31C2D8|nr:DoxX family protein [Nocardioides sp. cx-169]MCD4533656.1 DoxX family protein [Nocardioides sp. cx-169]